MSHAVSLHGRIVFDKKVRGQVFLRLVRPDQLTIARPTSRGFTSRRSSPWCREARSP